MLQKMMINVVLLLRKLLIITDSKTKIPKVYLQHHTELCDNQTLILVTIKKNLLHIKNKPIKFDT